MDLEQWAKINEIFSATLELPPDEREDYVTQKCGDDQSLRIEIKSLLDAHNQSEAFIESPAFAPLSKFVEDSVKTSRIGQTVGVYLIEKEIGRGGMGAVYLASRNDREFEKKVAVKLIKRGFDTDEIIRRFRNERQILAALEHPFITRLIDGGSTADGLPYLVMDYVEGEPLTDFCNKQGLSLSERLNIFLQICAAVSYAHQNLIIHRDLKPSNILISRDGTPKLLDFGIAKLTDSDGGTMREKTLTFFHAMTPEYASPEQVGGKPVTTASDIYSLGVVLYELLTGHRPFNFDSNRADEITRIITDTPPTKPSSICRNRGLKTTMPNPSAVVRKLQGDLDNIVLMAMRKEPERRYSTVEQFAEDIRRYLNNLPVIAQEDTFAYRAGKFISRNKAGVGAGTGIALSLISGIIIATRQATIARRERDAARKVNQFLQKMLKSADPRVGRKDVQVIEVLKTAAEDIERDFTRQPEIAADLHTTIGLTYLSVNQFEPAESHLRHALDIHLALYPRSSFKVAVSLGNYAKYFHSKGDFKTAEPLYAEALETLRRRQNQSPELAEILDDYGYLLALQGKTEKAIRLHQEEVNLRRRILGEDHPDLAKSLEKLGNALAMMDRREISEPLLRKALKILQNFHRREHPDIAQTMVNLAGTIYPKHPAEAEQLCRESLTMRRHLLGDEHADTAWSLYNLAFVLVNDEKYDEAENYLHEIIARRDSSLPEEHPVVASALLQLGRIFMAYGQFEKAKTAIHECLDLRRRTLSEDHWLIATTNSFLGECLYYLGEREYGRNLMIENFKILKESLGNDHIQTRQAFDRWKMLKIS